LHPESQGEPEPQFRYTLIVHSYLLHNGEIRKTSDLLLSPGQVGFLNGWGVFSTLRVDQNVLFCYQRHYQRMKRDAKRLKVPFPFSSEDLERHLLHLVQANGAYNSTLRVAVVRNKGGLFEGPDIAVSADLIAFTTDLRDWGSGVKLGYQSNARFGQGLFAGSKYTSWAENLTLYETAHERGLDEVVLLNENGQISECTSANIFVVQGDQICTPPLSTSGCLPGITRAILLEDIQVDGLTFLEKELLPSDLETSDGAFLSSSTRDVLPILSVDGLMLSHTNAHFQSIREAFSNYRASYVAAHRHEPVGV
jgi:branched-chain amino acid aminotransferase